MKGWMLDPQLTTATCRPPACSPCPPCPQAEPSGSQASSPQLSAEQQGVVDLVAAGKSVFFTGDAGTGKSFLLNHIIFQLREQHGEEFSSAVAITAATGIAATHIQGSTLHSALGCGLPRTTDDFGRMWKRENRERLRAFKVGGPGRAGPGQASQPPCLTRLPLNACLVHQFPFHPPPSACPMYFMRYAPQVLIIDEVSTAPACPPCLS